MQKIINVTSREERDCKFRELKQNGYKLVDCGYHWDLFQKDNEVIKVFDIR